VKKLIPPTTDDQQVLKDMCGNSRLRSYDFICQEYFTMKEQYSSYIINGGNPWFCESKIEEEYLKESLKLHYECPFQRLDFIKVIRDKKSADICPMCGSLKTATIDHFLPQAEYPDWAVFSKNLVPACDCNSKRSSDVSGENANQRVLHPYFDDCLNERLLSCLITGDLELPEIEVSKICSQIVADETIDFHIDTVVKRSTIISWLEAKWESLRKRPSSIIKVLPLDSPINELDLIAALNRAIFDSDEEHGSPNNWYSVFYHGVRNSQITMDWVVIQHNGLLDGSIQWEANVRTDNE
jgi:hypothetical protein